MTKLPNYQCNFLRHHLVPSPIAPDTSSARSLSLCPFLSQLFATVKSRFFRARFSKPTSAHSSSLAAIRFGPSPLYTFFVVRARAFFDSSPTRPLVSHTGKGDRSVVVGATRSVCYRMGGVSV